MKNSNKIGTNHEKIGMVSDDVRGSIFRVQCAFPNMERFVFSDEK